MISWNDIQNWTSCDMDWTSKDAIRGRNIYPYAVAVYKAYRQKQLGAIPSSGYPLGWRLGPWIDIAESAWATNEINAHIYKLACGDFPPGYSMGGYIDSGDYEYPLTGRSLGNYYIDHTQTYNLAAGTPTRTVANIWTAATDKVKFTFPRGNALDWIWESYVMLSSMKKMRPEAMVVWDSMTGKIYNTSSAYAASLDFIGIDGALYTIDIPASIGFLSGVTPPKTPRTIYGAMYGIVTPQGFVF